MIKVAIVPFDPMTFCELNVTSTACRAVGLAEAGARLADEEELIPTGT